MSILVLPFVAMLGAHAAPLVDEGHGWSWSELALDVWIEPDLGTVHLEGTGRLVLRAERSDGPLLGLAAALFDSIDVRSSGTRVEFARGELEGVPLLTARLLARAPLERGAELTVEFQCDSVRATDQFAIDPRAAVASWVEGWYPFPVDPARSLSDGLAARGRTTFHLPDGWQSVSNGVLEPQGEPESETWRLADPVARSYACAPFTTVVLDVDGREVGVHRLRSAREAADVELGAIAAILRVLEGRYGPYPYPGYRVAELPEGVGDFLGSSEQGFIMVRPVAFAAPDGNLALFAHELAHGWWGNRVASSGPGSMLLSEGLAQFSAVVAIRAIEGQAGATGFLRFSRPGYVEDQCARGYFQAWRDGKDHPLAEIESGGEAHFLADSKGHWVFDMLRRRMGDERFFEVLRGVVRDAATVRATLPDLRARFERAAPELDLARFFHQWMDRTGAPVLESEWTARGTTTVVRVRQLQPGEPYDLALAIAVDSAAGRRVHTVALAESETTFELPGDAPATEVELDPEHEILLWMPEYGPSPLR